jgi:hypothetical protein
MKCIVTSALAIALSSLGGSEALAALSTVMVAEGTKVVTETSRVTCFRGGDVNALKVIQGMPLLPGDLLLCTDGDVVMVLGDAQCQYSAVGPFRAYINADGQGGSIVDLLAGETEVRATAPSQLGSAWGSIHSPSTVYGMRIVATEHGPTQVSYVLDGAAVIHARGADVAIDAGQKAESASDSLPRVEALAPEDLERSAVLNANVDANAAVAFSSAKINRDSCYNALRTHYARLFANPKDIQARFELADAQVAYRVPNQALYQAKRIEELDPAGTQQVRAHVAVVRGAAYDQLGRTVEAKQQLDLARNIDATAVAPENLRAIRYDPAWVTDVQRRGDPQPYLFSLLDKRNYREAIRGFEDRVRNQTADSRDHLGLCRAYAATGNGSRACSEASIGLRSNDSDKRLAGEEANELRNRVARCRPDMRLMRARPVR